MRCPKCKSKDIRTFSKFNDEDDRWDWMKGCNDCPWESRDIEEEKKHPEYYTRMQDSPAKINSEDIKIK